MSGETALQVADLSKSFGGLRAVREVSFEIEAGRLTSLIGPNGAGKTTIFNLITGLVPADGGSVRLAGTEILGLSSHRLVGMGLYRSFQNLRLFEDLSVLDNVTVAVQNQIGENPAWLLAPRRVRRREREVRFAAMAHLERVGLADRARCRVSEVSYAEQKLVAIARGLATGAITFLLDEPGSGLDESSIDALRCLLRDLTEEGKTIVLVEHNLALVEAVSDTVIFLNHGEVRAVGDARSIFENEELKTVYMAGGVL